MSTKEDILKYLSDLKEKFKKELPRVTEEIHVYEQKVSKGLITERPTPGPQFNG